MKHRRKNNEIGLRATRPFQILHMDLTIFKCEDNSKVFLYMIIDNFSRKILGYKLSDIPNHQLALENWKEVIFGFNLSCRNKLLITDNGIENNTNLFKQHLSEDPFSNREIAQLTINQSNSMIESLFKEFKYFHVYPLNFSNNKIALERFPQLLEDIDNRPRNVLKGLTPNDIILKNMNPENQSFSDQLALARKIRKEENLKGKCGIC